MAKNTVKLARLIVLVVDDDKTVRQIIVEYLTLMGFQNILEASDGAEAYKYILDPLQRIDLVLCDWEMPKTDGLTLLRALRANKAKANIPFIMITSQQSQERMKITKAKKHMVDSYIIKPFRSETLQNKIFEVIFSAIEKKAI
jgi:two-component system chemotaxis response regulator CheY